MPPVTRPLILWRLLDGKPGHEKQTLGLANALGHLVTCQRIDIAAPPRTTSLLDWLRGRFPAGNGLPAPDLILAAGHTTHFAALAARRAHGGRIVLSMRPSLPIGWFDLCLIPEHDSPPARPNIVSTHGALNAVIPSDRHEPDTGLFLIGGSSSHYRWDNQDVTRQVLAILDATPGIHWRLTTSRRTPPEFLTYLARHATGRKLGILPHDATPSGWLEGALATTGSTWVTEDSVSMLYEALTAGAPVGLIRLPGTARTRVGHGITDLIQKRWLTPFNEWQTNGCLAPPPEGFDEAARCARQIIDRWPVRRGNDTDELCNQAGTPDPATRGDE